ncbi:beta-lactamase family protein [Streptomyces sp. NBC_01571]|nr:serine hydrolase domain-containing protein [Streptomyces sp. NBC_01571]MCX4573436.1 beta-lactamase family protein [Streptomyces sp. NBC_01571]
MPRLDPLSAAGHLLPGHGKMRRGAVLGEGLDAVLRPDGERLDQDARVAAASVHADRLAGDAGGLGRTGWAAHHRDACGACPGQRLEHAWETEPRVRQGGPQTGIVADENGVRGAHPGRHERLAHDGLVPGRPCPARLVAGHPQLGAEMRGELGQVLVDGQHRADTMAAGVRGARDHLLDLNRPVSDILPRFRIPGVTVSELIQHRGGIRDAESLLSLAGFRDLDHYTADDLLQLACRQQHRAVEPGRFLYSNTGYLLLSEILKHVHGTGLHEIADQQVFTPLGMASTRFKTDPREVIPGAAASYQPTMSGWLLHQQRPVTLPGPGSLWCTASDLDRWLDHLWHACQPAIATLPFEQHLSYRPSDHHPFTYGAGLYADPRTDRTAVFHYGHEHGFSAATHLTSSGLRVICLSNHTGIAADHVTATALAELGRHPEADPRETLSRALQHRPAPQSIPVDRPDSDTPHTPLGTYVCQDVPGTVRLTYSAGSLYLWHRGTRDRLTRTGPTTYTALACTLTLPTTPADGEEPAADGFVLDLDRAPGLHYQRQPTKPALQGPAEPG